MPEEGWLRAFKETHPCEPTGRRAVDGPDRDITFPARPSDLGGLPGEPDCQDREDLRMLAARLPELIAMANTFGSARLRAILDEVETLAHVELGKIGGPHDH